MAIGCLKLRRRGCSSLPVGFRLCDSLQIGDLFAEAHAADEDLGDLFVHFLDRADVAEGCDDAGADLTACFGGHTPLPVVFPPVLCDVTSLDLRTSDFGHDGAVEFGFAGEAFFVEFVL